MAQKQLDLRARPTVDPAQRAFLGAYTAQQLGALYIRCTELFGANAVTWLCYPRPFGLWSVWVAHGTARTRMQMQAYAWGWQDGAWHARTEGA